MTPTTDVPPAGSQDSTVSARDGTRLYHRHWPPAKTGRGTLLLVHGLKDHSGRYDLWARALADGGWDVHAFDLRGHGRSGGPRQRVRRFGEYVDDLEMEVLMVRQGSPDRPLFLFGHSMGGAIVARYLLERKPRVGGFVLSAAALKLPANVSRAAVGFTRLLSAITPSAHILRLAPADFSRDASVVKAMTEDPLIDPASVPARTAAELIATIELLHGSFAAFHDPFLALHGTADRITNPSGSTELAQQAASADKTFRSFEGLYHDLLHEPERAAVGQAIEEWLTRRL